jgi:hypothetical protein
VSLLDFINLSLSIRHALGYHHMHQHVDRDSKIRINWGNIVRGMESNFIKLQGKSNYGTPYDISSIMHYEPHAFSVNGRNTIEALNPADQGKIGGTKLTSGDIARINNMYKCKRRNYLRFYF